MNLKSTRLKVSLLGENQETFVHDFIESLNGFFFHIPLVRRKRKTFAYTINKIGSRPKLSLDDKTAGFALKSPVRSYTIVCHCSRPSSFTESPMVYLTEFEVSPNVPSGDDSHLYGNVDLVSIDAPDRPWTVVHSLPLRVFLGTQS